MINAETVNRLCNEVRLFEDIDFTATFMGANRVSILG
jgi:hypothetical protein